METAGVFLTEKATIVRATSPLTIEEISYPIYNITAKVGDENATKQINLSDKIKFFKKAWTQGVKVLKIQNHSGNVARV